MKGKPLPRVAAVSHPVGGRLVFVCRNQVGFWEAETLGVVSGDLTADKWNEAHGISKAEEVAMLNGSLWGWHTAAADPESYDADGKPVVKLELDA